MIQGKVVALLLLITLVSANVSIHNLGLGFVPQDQLEYVNYLKLILGRHDESTSLSPSFLSFAKQHRPSFLNALDQVAIVFVPHQDNEQIEQAEQKIALQGQLLEELVSQTPQLFVVSYLSASEKARLDGLIESFKTQNKAVHIIRGSAQLLKRLFDMLNPEKLPKSAQPRRLNEKQTTPSPSAPGTYLIKFFFSLLFIITIIGIVGFIANDHGKKDTLLYAKFIADVQGAVR